MADHVGWPAVRTTMEAALHFATLRADPGGERVSRPPGSVRTLMRIYERGGSFTTKAGFVDVTGAFVPMRPIDSAASADPMPARSLAFLDELDCG